jgi:CBS domain-containing protein
MTITRILADKGRDVVTTRPHRTLAEVAEVLVTNNIGAIVVIDDQGSVLGILSERDIVRAVVKCGTAVFNDAVSTHMTTKLVTTSEDESVDVAMEKMTDQRSRHLPVISHGKLSGLVSIGDVVKYRLGACQYEHKAMREYIATG